MLAACWTAWPCFRVGRGRDPAVSVSRRQPTPCAVEPQAAASQGCAHPVGPLRAQRVHGAVRTHVALLRGINVLGRNKVSMAELRQVVADMGHEEVATYIQSGNVVFAASRPVTGESALADALESEIAVRLSVRPSVVVVSRSELHQVVRTNPFPRVADPRSLHAVFLRDAPDAGGINSVTAAVERAVSKGSRDDARVVDRTLYLWTPDGFARSILRAELDRGGKLRSPMSAGTARNWATVGALVSLLDESL